MKKLSQFFAGFMLLAASFSAKAQTTPPKDYFVGKWNVEVKGTPQGDGKMLLTLDRKDGKLTGYLSGKGMADSTKFSKVEETDKAVTVYFTSQGYDINIKLEKKDDDHTVGSMMDMFDAFGERVKETAKKP